MDGADTRIDDDAARDGDQAEAASFRGWSATDTRVGTYPVPVTQWGATDIESNPAPDVAACWIRASDLPTFFDAEDLWTWANGVGAWDGKGGFAVHLFPPSIAAP